MFSILTESGVSTEIDDDTLLNRSNPLTDLKGGNGMRGAFLKEGGGGGEGVVKCIQDYTCICYNFTGDLLIKTDAI